MNWEIIKKKNLSEIKDLILKKEWAYISFSSRFRQLVKNKLKFKNDCTIIANHRKDIQYIREAVMLTRGGLILPLLEQNPEKKHYNILRFYLSSFKDYMRKLHSIMGLYNDVAIIEELLPVTASHHV